MGEFVCDHVRDQLLLVLGACRRVNEQQALAERDTPQVLHGSCSEVREAGQVDFVAGVRDPVVLLEPAEAKRPDVLTEVS